MNSSNSSNVMNAMNRMNTMTPCDFASVSLCLLTTFCHFVILRESQCVIEWEVDRILNLFLISFDMF